MTIESANIPEVAHQSSGEIKVKFFGSIREAAGKTEDHFDSLPGTTVYKLLNMISDAYGDAARAEIFDGKAPEKLRDDLMITYNDSIINHGKATEAAVNPGDVVALFPVCPGGG